jgi:hydroxymethylglutaryl-CoA lyase
MISATIEVVEVGPRDGLQNEKALVSTADKVSLIERAIAAGVRRIEVASFVDPIRVPQMADAEDVCAALGLGDDVITIGLALNRQGCERALATNVRQIGAVVSASDGFGIANQGRTSHESVEDAIEIIELARATGRPAQVTISASFGCPFDGPVEPRKVADIAAKLAAVGPLEIAIADTIGVAVPGEVSDLLRRVRATVPGMPLRAHFHDTRGTAVANAWAAIQEGVVTLDGAIGGAGGCPFAPGATGNAATEDLLYLLEKSGIATGVDREAIRSIVPWLSKRLGRPLNNSSASPY